MKQHHVSWAPYHHGMKRPPVAVGRVKQIGVSSDEMLYNVRSEGLAGESVHCAGLLVDTGVELLDSRPSPAEAASITYLRYKIRRKEDEMN
jgi:hypothetical protein